MRKMKNKTKKIIKFVLLALAGIALFAAVANVSSGFDNMNPKDWKLRTVNEDNLYQQMAFADNKGVFENGADGLTVKLDEETNAITLSGSPEMDKNVMIGTLKLKANTSYVFDGDLSNGTNKTVYMYLTNNSTGEIIKSYNGPVEISALSQDTEFTLSVFVAKDNSIRKTLKPIICVGENVDDVVGFYK